MALQWIGSPEHTRWLGQHTQALLDLRAVAGFPVVLAGSVPTASLILPDR